MRRLFLTFVDLVLALSDALARWLCRRCAVASLINTIEAPPKPALGYRVPTPEVIEHEFMLGGSVRTFVHEVGEYCPTCRAEQLARAALSATAATATALSKCPDPSCREKV